MIMVCMYGIRIDCGLRHRLLRQGGIQCEKEGEWCELFKFESLQ